MKTPKVWLLNPIVKHINFNLLLCLLIAVFSYLSGVGQVPSINAVIPASAPIASTITIQGNNFNPAINGNTVFFGAVKAQVVSASSTSLSVIVPDGATYQPISVTSNGLTAYSPQPFIVTFSGSYITRNAFSTPTKFNTGYYPDGIVAVDLDGDGKVDIATANNANKPYSTFSVLRNISTSGQVNFAPTQEFISDTMPQGIAAADLDGDGKQDLLITSINNSVSIYRNTSTIGSISFDSNIDYPTDQLPESIAIGDLNGDGKPDLVISNSIGVTITVYLNASTPGNISFKKQANLISGISPTKVCLADLDGDGKLDVAVTNNLDNSISVFRNTSTLSTISFTTKTDYKVSYGPQGIAAGDLDGDGKPDLAVVNGNNETLTLFRNTSVPGSISFFQYVNFSITISQTSTAYGISISDLDGDGKPDLAIAANDELSILKNQSKPGSLSFGNYNIFYTYGISELAISDLDGDGKPDIAANSNFNNISVYRNTSDAPVFYSISPLSASAGAKVMITGVNFNDITDISFGGVSASSFTQTAADTIIAIVGNGASGNVTLTTSHGTAYWSGFIFQGPPIVKSFTPDSGAIGNTITIRGNNFTSVSSVTFGGTPAQYFVVDSPSVIRAHVALGSSGYVQVKTIYGSDSLNGFHFIPPPHIKSFSPKVAQQDSLVTIIGDGFTNASAVTFGSFNASSFLVLNDSTISAKLSNGNSGTIIVTTPGGTASKDSFKFVPTILSFNPIRAGFGTAITIVGKNFTGITGVNFGSYRAYSYKVVSTDTIIATVWNGESGNVTIFTNNGSISIPGFNFIPPPRILSYNPTMAGPGSKVTITGVNFSDAQEVRFGTTQALSYSVVNDSTITAIMGSGSSGSLFVRTPGGRDSIGYLSFTSNVVIHNVTPFSAPVGTLVTIQGANFSLNPANNKVYFGAVAAEVISCTANTITVKVPFGSTYQPITVATDNHVASSATPFIVTLPVPIKIDSNSFRWKTDFSTGMNPGSMAVGDLDGDGKPDIVVINQKDETISIYKNTSIVGQFSFSRIMDIPSGSNPHQIKLADIDGDGKLDILYINASFIDSVDHGNLLSVMKNISTLQNIRFRARQTYTTAFNPDAIVVADLNQDAKIDVAILHSGQKLLTLYENNSIYDSISFWHRNDYQVFQNDFQTQYPISMDVADLNHDGLPDLIMLSDFSLHQIYFINHSSGPGFGFIEKDERDLEEVRDVHATDLDLDGWPDIITNDRIWRNNHSLYDNIQMQNQPNATFNSPLAFNDLNGDGLPDYVVGYDLVDNLDSTLYIYQNKSQPGKIVIDSPIKFKIGTGVTDIEICDFDGDGNPDIAFANWYNASFSILRNQNGSRPITLCVGSNILLPGQIQSGSYQWQVNSGNGFTNLNDDNFYTGTNSNSLQLQNVPLSANGFQYRCILDTTIGPLYTLIISDSTVPQVSINPLDNILCSQSIAGISANTLFGGTNPSYYWMINGTVKDSTGYLLKSQFQDQDKVQVLMKSNRSCIKSDQAISNILTLKVGTTIVPKGNIIGPSRACLGSTFPIIFKAGLVPIGTRIQLWYSRDNINYDSLSTQVYNNKDLQFDAYAFSPEGKKWFFFSLNQDPEKCIQQTHTDTITVYSELLFEPRFNVINNSLTIMNPDTSLKYTWQIQISASAWNDINLSGSGYTFFAGVSGYYRLKASSQTCTVYSSQVSLIITAIDPVSNLSNGITFYPNPASTFLHFDNLRASDLWETIEIIGVDGLPKLPIKNIRNATSFDVLIKPLSSGTYFAVLRRKNGSPLQLKFIKL